MILYSKEFTDELRSSLETAQSRCFLASAFVKQSALEELSQSFPASVGDISVVARWQKRDILAGASDLAVYEFCREHGWRFGIAQNFHGKLYMIDDSELFLGSANLTQQGLLLGYRGNNEFGTKIPVSFADLSKVQRFIDDEVIWLDDSLYSRLRDEISSSQLDSVPLAEVAWSSVLFGELQKSVAYLWVNELLFCSPAQLLTLDLNDEAMRHDFELLSLSIDDLTEAALVRSFRRTRLYLWLNYILRSNSSVSFGKMSSELHKSLMDDPVPYRRDVKKFVAAIFDWCELLKDDIEFTQFRRTSALSLKNP